MTTLAVVSASTLGLSPGVELRSSVMEPEPVSPVETKGLEEEPAPRMTVSVDSVRASSMTATRTCTAVPAAGRVIWLEAGTATQAEPL